MNSESVDLIATDPPFNKGRDFHATPDSLAAGAKFQDRWSWERDVHESWVDEIADDRPHLMKAIESARHAHSDGMGAYMCFMAVRLLAMHRVLKPTGSIYLHCDPTASHYLKAVMDAIFGWKNFVNEVIWRRAISHNDAGQYGNITDNVFLYGKGGAKRRWNGQAISTPKTPEQMARSYPSKDERGRFRSADLTGPLHSAQRGLPSTEPWGEYDVFAMGRCWSAPLVGRYAEFIERHFIPGYRSIKGVHERLDALDRAGLIHHPKAGKWPGLKRYAEADQGNPPQNLILQPTGFTNFNKGPEATGYATQKPEALYEIFIKASSDEGDFVLDPFCGCATTLVAAEKLQRRWVGIDIWEGAHKLVRQRLEDATGFFGKVSFTDQVPDRTDDGETSAPYLRVKQRVKEPDGPRWTRKETYDHLLDQNGSRCMGCDRTFDDPRYLELDHNIPRSDGGINHVTNRILLCGPCNKLKSNIYTLSGLRRENKKRGYMVKT